MLLHKIYATNIVTNSILTLITLTNSNNALVTMPRCGQCVLIIRIAIKYTVNFFVFYIVYNAKLTYVNKL